MNLHHKIFTGLLLACSVLLIGCNQKRELKWNKERGYSWAKISTISSEKVGFEQINPSESNIHFRNQVSNEDITENRFLLNGSGVAVGDIDGDGWVDIYFAKLDGPNKLYKNLGGFNFKDITQKAGVAHKKYHSTGVVFADVDGDRDLDLLVTSLLEKNVLYVNDGNGHFNLSEESGLDLSNGSTSMALADIDNDLDLDLYVTNYKKKTVRDIFDPKERSLKNTVKPVDNTYKIIPPFDKYYTMIFTENRPYRKEYGEKDQLYLNEGGSFKKVEDQRSFFLNQSDEEIGLSRDWGLTAMFHDINNDNKPDLYVCNDFWTPDRIWINQGNSVFKEADSTVVRNFSFASMAVDFSDINRDGAVDFFVSEMLSPVHKRRMRQFSEHLGVTDHNPLYNKNSMYLNRKDQTFIEIANYSGLEASGWSWATNFLDIDLDGFEDLAIATGNAYDVRDLDTQLQLNRLIDRNIDVKKGILKYPSLKLSNKLFRNNHDLTFSDKSEEWGFNTKDISQGMALADLDNDGDYDLITNRLNETAGLFKNITSAPRIAVRLKGKKPNTQAIGAKIKMIGADVIQEKEIVSGGRYLSGSSTLVTFAGKQNSDHFLKVMWPNGSKSIIDSVKTGRIYEVDESSIATKTIGKEKSKEKLENKEFFFKDISERINHFHHENKFDDFKVQPLLLQKLSQQGPGIAWIDFDKDNDDDLFVGSGKGGTLDVFENMGGAEFKSVDLKKIKTKAIGDQTAIVSWSDKQGIHIVIGIANYESPSANVASAKAYLINSNKEIKQDSLDSSFSTSGPIALADYDGDQDIDLFIGGRFRQGVYPMNANSRLFKNDMGDFKLDKNNSDILKNIGLTTSAVFSDYDQDGDQDLLLGREWDSILLLENINGNFHDISEKVGLSNLKGWWNGIATGDFNNDGLPDIIATNLGLNSVYQNDSKFPLKMYYNDLNQDGHLDIVDSFYDRSSKSYVPRRKLYEFNSIRLSGIKNHKQYANSSLNEIFNRDFSNIPSKEINTLENTLFINRRDTFEAKSLPKQTQMSAAFDASVADFNNDGNEDVFLTQNFFDFATGTPRLDAGLGLWLKGDGRGDFNALSGNKTGIKIYGEQRGAAISDYNSDGKIDLVVSQNGGKTKLYLNSIKKSGIRVRLIGPDKNKDAIGSSIKLIYEDGSEGPLREIQAGSGYWSQNSSTKILGTNKTKTPAKIEVRWPDSSYSTVNISYPKKTYEIVY